MTDPSEEILDAIETTLQGNLKYPATTGDVWHVYADDPNADSRRCVVLVDLNMYDDGGDDTLDCDLTIEVMDGGQYIGAAKTAPVNAIGSQIMALLSKKAIAMTSYKMTVLPFLEENNIFKDIISSGMVVPRKVMRVRFSCKES